MKSIQEYLVNQPTQRIGSPVVNELFGVLFASSLIAWVLKDNIKDMMSAWNQHKVDKYKHQEEMFKAATERKEKQGEEPSLFQQIAAGGGIVGALSAIFKGAQNEKDPVEQKKTMSKLDLLRASAFDDEGNERTPEDRKKWLQQNMSPADFKEFCESSVADWLKTDMKGMSDALEETANSITEKDMEAEAETAKKTYKDFGKQLEADAAARKKLQEAIDAKNAEKDAAQAELDKAIAEATAAGDEDAIKKAKLAKAEYNKKMDQEIYDATTAAIDFESNCQTSVIMNVANPGRTDRIAKAKAKADEDHKKAVEAADKEISDNGGDPKNTDPEVTKKAEDPEKKDGEPDPEAAKKAEEAKKAADEAAEAKKKADEDVAAAEKVLKDNTDDTKKEELQKDLDAKKAAAEEAGKKAEETKKAADEAAKAAQAKPAETKTGKEGETKPDPEKKAEDPKGSEKKGGNEKEEVKTVDKDGDTDGGKIVKWTNKEGKETYIYYDADGESTEVAKDDFEQAKENYKKAMDNVDLSQDDDDDEHKKAAEGGDVDADDKDTDAEEVDDEKGGKKKVLKNPAQIWHRKKKKNGGGSTKSYYNKKGDSISQKEFQEKMQKYKAKTKNESFQEFLRNPFVMERVSKYTSLRDRMRTNIHD